MNGKVLVVDDELNWRHTVSSALQEAGHEVVVASSGEEAMEILSAGPADFGAIVTDYNMGRERLNGAGLIARAKELCGDHVLYVIYTGSEIDTSWGADIFLFKLEFSSDMLLAAVGNPGA